MSVEHADLAGYIMGDARMRKRARHFDIKNTLLERGKCVMFGPHTCVHFSSHVKCYAIE